MRLPFAVSVPHASYQIPAEITPTLAFTPGDIMEADDLGAREIFASLPVMVALWSRWSRLVVDLDRDSEERGPRGVVPLKDSHGRNIYKEGGLPEDEEVERRLKVYYRPYHFRLQEAIQDPEIKILFDCHSLAPMGPSGALDPMKWKKDIVLANNGNPRGEKDPFFGEITCPSNTLQMMKEILNESGFSVSINQPYSGGFITAHYGKKLIEKGKMAVRMEINQELYVDGETRQMDRFRLGDAARRVQKVFREFGERI
ncbi:MAG: N-formylglutamate amidohydrolase [Deltaproteobacteria bacterium]|nr:N-formylglutamate amidohydrolase [Deltaproteobacteria bacterium]